jgi:putative FmdB family regulatory protein
VARAAAPSCAPAQALPTYNSRFFVERLVMPIYAYKCESCGHRQDVLQKVSDPVLSTCPVCAAPSFVKQVTAAGFQLKGSGWYATDFRGGTPAKSDDPDAKPADKTDTKTDAKSEPKAAGAAGPATPAAAPTAAAPAPDKPRPSTPEAA